ncbi:MAG TPA: class I SAM-dependent methyltransferase [Solirubrobacterales bacterium]|jgi:SAM-dependent methyltransferase|nr:class I SAM-dependent methyltransferase [Solirubrobacterales bacterium]
MAGRTRCPACGVATIDPWPSEQQLDEAYAGEYRPAEGRFSGLGDALLRRTRATLAGRLDRIAPPGPVLDVGAGEGALLDALHARGREALGLERSSRRPDVAEWGLDDLEGEWAAIVFWHSLEHLPDPAAALERAGRLLAPGGVLVVAVPNSDSLQAKLFGDRWLALDPPRHLFHFTAAALMERLRTLGLRVRRVSYARGGQVLFGWLDGLVGALPGQLSLYDAIRRPQARFHPVGARRRLLTLLAAVLLLPVGLLASATEVWLRRGGTVYVEAVHR